MAYPEQLHFKVDRDKNQMITDSGVHINPESPDLAADIVNGAIDYAYKCGMSDQKLIQDLFEFKARWYQKPPIGWLYPWTWKRVKNLPLLIPAALAHFPGVKKHVLHTTPLAEHPGYKYTQVK